MSNFEISRGEKPSIKFWLGTFRAEMENWFCIKCQSRGNNKHDLFNEVQQKQYCLFWPTIFSMSKFSFTLKRTAETTGWIWQVSNFAVSSINTKLPYRNPFAARNCSSIWPLAVTENSNNFHFSSISFRNKNLGEDTYFCPFVLWIVFTSACNIGTNKHQ